MSNYLDEKVVEILNTCIKNDVVSQESIDKVIEKNPDTDSAVLNKSILRQLGINDFRAYASIINFDIFSSPTIYPKIIKERMYSTKPIFFLMIPRGTWKSVLMLAGWEEWEYLRSRTLGNKQAVNTCFIHGNMDKANSDLETVKQHIKMEIVQYLYGDIFKITVDNATQFDFEDTASPIPLKECAFEAGSVESDLAGKHFARLALDDFATDKNCMTPEANEKNKKAFYKLFSLADRVEGRIMKIAYIGTPYFKNSITEELQKHQKWDRWCDRVVIPASHTIVEDTGDMREIYPFHQLPKEQIEMYRDTLPSDEFKSQYYMLYYDRDSRLEPPDLPEYYDPFNVNDVRYSPIDRCVLLVDPANSQSNKNRKSLMVILVAAITERKEIFVVDGCFLRGTTPSQFRDRVTTYAKNYPVEDAIIEAVAAQMYMANDIREHAELGGMGRYFGVIKHKHYENKREHYRSFLEPLFRRQIIHINPELKELIDELNGMSSFEDAIDCLSFIKELRMSFVPPKGETYETENERTWGEIKKVQKRLKRRPSFGIITPWV